MTIMLKNKTLAAWSRRGVVALAVPVSLVIPVTASAAVTGGPGGTYVNQATAASYSNRYRNLNVKFQLKQSSASTVNATNEANATTRRCRDCGAIAIGFQVMLVSSRNLSTVNAVNTANSISTNCTNCTALAAAYQIVDAAGPQRLTSGQEAGLDQIGAEVQALEWSRLGADEIQTEAYALAKQAVSLLQNSPVVTPGTGTQGAGPTSSFRDNTNGPLTAAYIAAPASSTPAISNSDVPLGLTEDTQPMVELNVKVQNPAG
jgi:putative peptide zinc metalloprotease protein